MTYSYHDLRALLASHEIPDADFDALTLLEAFTGTPRSAILADPTRECESDALTEAVEKRIRRVPLQYILGKWEFMAKCAQKYNEKMAKFCEMQLLMLGEYPQGE